MKWVDSIKAAIPGLLASPGAEHASPQAVLDDAPSSVRQVAIIGEQELFYCISSFSIISGQLLFNVIFSYSLMRK